MHKLRTTWELDRYHAELLNSRIRTNKVAGALSVIFWGHISGKKAKLNPPYAMAKVKRAVTSSRFCSVRIASYVSEAARLIRRKKYGEAVLRLTNVPQLGFAFASKVCAFISGENCGVIDSVIVKKYSHFGFHTRSGFVTKSQWNAAAYDRYCRYLQKSADSLNRAGVKLRWRDREGKTYLWRAVDVERALYG